MTTLAIDHKPAPPKKQGIDWRRIGLHLILIFGAIFMLMPFLWMVSTSLKSRTDVFSEFPPLLIPSTIYWENYETALTSVPFDRFYLNSIIVAIAVTIIQLFTSSLAAFAFARLKFRGRDALFILYLIGLMIPFPVLLLPNFIIIRELGWFDTLWALIIPPSFSAFSTFLMRQYYRGIPLDFDEAARIDGASTLRIWWNIILPNSKPVLAALSIFIFLNVWNDFLWPLVVTNSVEMRTIPVGLSYFQGQYGVNWELLMAAAVVAMLPVLIVYFFAQNTIIKGMSVSGGIKG